MTESVLPEYMQKKLVHPNELLTFKVDGSLATLNGSFDLLHAGHLHIIFEAKKMADYLLVALNSDDSIKRYKGENRPIISLMDRIQMMAALEFVDFVTWFEEDTPKEFLKKVRPQVHVNGADWGENCIEKDVVKEIGAKLHIVDLKPGLSTSKILEKIKKLSV